LAGLRVAQIISGTLVSAIALKQSRKLTENGHAVIVDVGASKVQVSLVVNTPTSVREIRTEGTDEIGATDIVHAVFASLLPSIASGNPFALARLAGTVQRAMESGSHQICIPDIGNGQSYKGKIDESEIEKAHQPLALAVRDIIARIAPPDDHEIAVKAVECIGGGTKDPEIARGRGPIQQHKN
jgi:molecular chaperone DnaK (HSP70)